MSNPFILTFGKKPNQYISRPKAIQRIIESFTSTPSPEQIYMITGIRGSGKTVTMTAISKELQEHEDFIVVDLNSDKDLLEGLASELYQNSKINMIFTKKEFSFSFKGISFSIEGATPVLTVETLIKMMLEKIQKKNKKVLITIDEVTNNGYMKIFAKTFQALVRQDLPVYLIMTGLYENISKLQDDKTLTFLYRAPKIYLESLNISSIAFSYKNIFNISDEQALKMANLTNGYAYAYQVLGYLVYENNGIIDDMVINNFDQYLQEFVYDKLWFELSTVEKNIMKNFPEGEISTKDLISKIEMDNSYFSMYRDRLIKKGIIYSPSYGKVKIVLPRFYNYIKSKEF
ncbi:MAG: ATP-binding protein [Acholeplasmatales bacterium]|nr:ATP-binding protein [Acholeplasmatales bacterium]